MPLLLLPLLQLATSAAAATGTAAASGSAAAAPPQRDAGVLYEIWHTTAAHLMHRVQASGATQPLTVESVIRSDGKHDLDGVFDGPSPLLPAGFSPDIYNVQPQLGFYCLYRPRPGENVTADTPVCPNITGVTTQHAKWLSDAGYDYVAIDITNWPLTGRIGHSTTTPSTDMTILRPLEVLAEEWLALRKQGIKTPSIAAWPTAACGTGKMCMGKKGQLNPDGGHAYAMWRWVLDEFYNNPKYSDIIYKPFDADGKKLLFLPSPASPAYDNASFVELLESNGGRDDVRVVSMWAMSNSFAHGAWGFFSFCHAPCNNAPPCCKACVCPPSPPPPPAPLPCPKGQRVDAVAMPGDNGSCDCDSFCASDWTGVLKTARPHWVGAASAVPGAKLNCKCVQATHYCPRAPVTCRESCSTAGKPKPKDYCVPGPPPPPPQVKMCPTTSMVDVPDCNQQASVGPVGSGSPVTEWEISASSAYMTDQSALPGANPGHMRGLTMQRLFKKVLERGAPHLFMSSFNELIGGRQPSHIKANTAINMGLPYDSQNRTVWVDTYASEFSRDFEPTVEAGDRMLRVTTSCVSMYKAGRTCEDDSDLAAQSELCCTTADKEVFANVWSFQKSDGSDSMLTSNQTEADELYSKGSGWKQQCNPVSGPTVFCVDSSLLDSREGPFMVYSVR